MITKQTSYPILDVVDIDQALEHSRITEVEDEVMVEMALESAHSSVQQWLNRKIVTTTMRGIEPIFKKEIVLPYPPIQSVESVTYTDANDVSQTLNITDYSFDDITGSVKFKTDLSKYKDFIVNYTCGYNATDVIPPAVKHAIRMTFATLYEMREDALTGTQINEVPVSARNIIKSFRVRSTS